ncbi:MAG: VanZ family protein [Nitrospira sp.]|nr:VanZ family protein [Nitrospira sp.]
MGVEAPRKIMHFTWLQPKNVVLWFLLVVLSIAPLFPLSNYVGHPHWDLIRWIPFQDFSLSRNMLKDVIGNILWFMMFGYLLRYQLNEGSVPLRAIATIIVVASGISLSIEFFQVFCHNRIPSTTDVICNVLGASIGGYFAEKQRATAATGLAYAIIKSDGSKTLR